MSPLESLMREWLESGTPAQRLHAAARFATPFPDEVTAPARPRAVLPRWPACGSREVCNCTTRGCTDPVRGPRFASPVTEIRRDNSISTRYVVDADGCNRCVSEGGPH